MKENENWMIYNPTNIEFETSYDVEPVHGDNGLKFIVDRESCKIEIVFECLVPVYTYSLEGIRAGTWGPLQLNYGDKIPFEKWFLYQIESSKFLNWALDESCGLYNNIPLVHYCIITEESMIDILATSEPKIKIL